MTISKRDVFKTLMPPPVGTPRMKVNGKCK